MTQHFFKALIVFIIMIALGLIGLFLVSYFDQASAQGLGSVAN